MSAEEYWLAIGVSLALIAVIMAWTYVVVEFFDGGYAMAVVPLMTVLIVVGALVVPV